MNLTACPICQSKDFQQVLQVKDQLVSRETFTIAECKSCTLRFTNPRPEENELGKFYDSKAYISHTNEANTLIDRLYKLARYFTLRSKERLIKGGKPTKSLLDIGCGTGHFINHCQEEGWQVVGVEPDPQARKIASKEEKLQVFASLEDIEDARFDRITLWHVLEHLPRLDQNVQKLRSLLMEDGKVFIAVPNYLAYEASVFQENWAAYDVPRHLYHFTPNAMQQLCKKYGLKIEQTYPMWLDSFYISLLSNKHKYGHNKPLNSFVTGLLSNIYAYKSRNYSSLIYQLVFEE